MEQQLAFFLALAVGLIFGGLAVWLMLRAETHNSYAHAKAEMAAGHSVLVERLSGKDARIEDLTKDREQLKAEIAKQNAEISGLRAARAELEARIAGADKAMEEKLDLVKQAEQAFANTFKALSQEALHSNNKTFLDLAKTTLDKYQDGAQTDLASRQQAIDAVVKPLRESLTKVDAVMREMEKSGLVEIHSHTMTHTQYPVSEEIVDFVSPKSRIDWLHWNLFPEEKPHFFSHNKSKLPLGYPVYKADKAIIAKRVIENGELSNALVDFVRNSGGEKFFNKDNWKNILDNFADNFKKDHANLFRKETKEEYIQRLEVELLQSKLILEKNLNKKINHLCWPFGAWNEETLELADKYGYETTTAKGGKNIFGKKRFNRVDRIALDNPKYQNKLFYLYAVFKILQYKF